MANAIDPIGNFVSSMNARIDAIDSASFSSYGDTFKRGLLCSLLDALATTAVPTVPPPSEQMNQRNRFTSLIRSFSHWPDSHRVSLPQLELLLSLTGDSKFNSLKAFVGSLPSAPQTAIMDLRHDPEFSEVDQHWPRDNKDCALTIEKTRLEYLRHDHLFYTLRNKLIHELLTPGSSLCVPGIQHPYYHRRVADGKPDTWILVYPTTFLVHLTRTILSKLEDYYRSGQINPWEFFEFGPHWLEPLNRG